MEPMHIKLTVVDVWRMLAFATFVMFAMTGQAHAQRVALVIGNATYQVGPLTNPPNDVREMEKALRSVGFKVRTVLNASQNQMRRALRDFGEQAEGAEIAFFYFSGHGTQANGENYLIPVDATIQKQSDYDIEAVGANGLMRQISSARPKAAIVVLDACRDNPYPAITKSTSKGLARMEAPTGSMIAFATAPNATASDDGNYARILAKYIASPNVELYDVFRHTNEDVSRLSNGQQVPRVSEVSITQRIYLAGIGQSATAIPKMTSLGLNQTSVDQEQEAWLEVKDSRSIAALEAVLMKFPNGKYAVRIEARLATLREHQSNSTGPDASNSLSKYPSPTISQYSPPIATIESTGECSIRVTDRTKANTELARVLIKKHPETQKIVLTLMVYSTTGVKVFGYPVETNYVSSGTCSGDTEIMKIAWKYVGDKLNLPPAAREVDVSAAHSYTVPTK